MDVLLHEKATSCAADVTLVEEDPVDDALDGLVDGSVVEDDVRRLAAELERDLLGRPRRRLRNRPPDGCRAGEGDLVDIRMVDECGTGVPGARDDVDDPRGQVGLLEDLREEERGEGRGLCGLQNDRVAGCERGGDLPGEHEQREVPRDDLRGDPEGAGGRPETGVVELVGPSCVVEEPGRDERDVDVAALLDRLAVVEALGDGELARALLHEPGDAEQVLAAVGAAQPRPGLLVGAARGRHSRVDIRRVRVRDRRDRALVGRGDRRERRSVPLPEVPVDEEPVALPEVQDALRLGCRSVFEEAHGGFS